MIDTVVLTLPNAHKLVWEPDKFTPSLKDLITENVGTYGNRMFKKYVQNINPKNGYYPRLSVTPRWQNGLQVPMRIEFSVPKLIYDDNLNEVSENDFDKVLTVLRDKLKEMGVYVLKEQLRRTSISVAHFSKNILLQDHFTASQVINTLSKVDTNKTLDINYRHFQNKGHALYFDCSSYQIVVYDKIQDLNKTKRHTVDKDPTIKQQDLFSDIKSHCKSIEVVRLEVRITNRAKLKALLSNQNPTFKDVFIEEVAINVLNNFWNKISSSMASTLLANYQNNVLRGVFDTQKQQGIKLTGIESLGIAYLIEHTNKHGLRDLRNTFTSYYSTRTWQRLNKYLDFITTTSSIKQSHAFLPMITNSLTNYEPFIFNLGSVE